MVREEIRKGIERYLKVKYAKKIEDAEEFEIFNAVSLTIMEEIIDQWNDTKELYGDGKQAFYLSAEYLMGRALGNNLISTGLYDDVKAVLEELNIDINKIEEIEEDAGLGNGGLWIQLLQWKYLLQVMELDIAMDYFLNILKMVSKRKQETSGLNMEILGALEKTAIQLL